MLPLESISKKEEGERRNGMNEKIRRRGKKMIKQGLTIGVEIADEKYLEKDSRKPAKTALE